ncbi:D-alanyl-D-alanine carboxypeptidase/D-alanyl-D-alanine-endopeptidase [Solitalea lacus]|uniref:D-alanyl-D-alanine carboxypeptidase/D-alanyl-D-alanine endopeptidase n=1 Tax=Solitalea lacus TaxID=2911172 RepID=UPI001EDA1DFA|nr:D-alanyl-D-alanine carboxypeptidase/D-alanyl-D-alanine-endopeptidase [Solitalea lacus]UKJ06105.1 D-alanyl-D-alanine carboxypeptidase/D-alanyl-D-alanine-endopeptidase [Solitalea lacus]
MLNRFTLFFLFSLFSHVLSAQTLKQKLSSAITVFSNDVQLKYASIGLTVLNAQSGATIYTHNPDLGLAPASTLKTITSATALSLLGENYHYKTVLGYTGNIDNEGVLHGDLIIKGSGDPTLGSWRYDQTNENLLLSNICNAVKYIGIKKVDGKLIADDNIFSSQSIPVGWIWQDIGNYYGTGTSALTWRENQFDITLKAGKEKGSSVQVLSYKPEMSYITLNNELKTGSKGDGDDAYVFLAPYATEGYLRGKIGLDETNLSISAAVPDPAFECAYRIKGALEKEVLIQTIDITTARRMQKEGKSVPTISRTLLDIHSPDLSRIVYWFNKKSVNLYGEQLIRTFALEKQQNSTTEAGIEIEKEFWSQNGLDKNSLNIIDGSGLSPANRVTTYSMAKVLYYAYSQPWFNSFYNSLPESNGLKMKDGYINGVRSYAGYVNAKDGNTYLFAFIVNNFNGNPREIREKMWKILDMLK